jgi:DNA-binding transcriptional ArsR family regulator
MVKYSRQHNKDSRNIDLMFGALADDTRREILFRLSKEKELNISDIASPYIKEKIMSFPAISKHIKKLEQSGLIKIKIDGRTRIVTANPKAILRIQQYISFYTKFWNTRLDNLEKFLKESKVRKNEQ